MGMERKAGLVEVSTGTVVPHDLETAAGGLRGAVHFVGVTVPKRTAKDARTDDAMVVRALGEAGWAGFRGWVDGGRCHRSLFGRNLADMRTVLVAAEEAGLSAPDSLDTYLDTADVGLLSASRDESAAIRDGDFPTGTLLAGAASLNRRLNALMDALARSPAADAIVVFGSMARGKHAPGDLDTYVDLATAGREAADWCRRELLAVARRHGSYDPFLMTRRGLFVRDPDYAAWDAARGAKAILRGMEREGVPLASVTRPAETPEGIAERCGIPPTPDRSPSP